jgi:hypothetical protein
VGARLVPFEASVSLQVIGRCSCTGNVVKPAFGQVSCVVVLCARGTLACSHVACAYGLACVSAWTSDERELGLVLAKPVDYVCSGVGCGPDLRVYPRHYTVVGAMEESECVIGYSGC